MPLCTLLHAMDTEQKLSKQNPSCQNNYELLTNNTLKDIDEQKMGFYGELDRMRVLEPEDEYDARYARCKSCSTDHRICTPQQLALATLCNVSFVSLGEALVAAWLAYEGLPVGIIVCTAYGQLAIIPSGMCCGCAMWCLACEDS